MKKAIEKLLSYLFPVKHPSDWQRVFMASKVNGAPYTEPPVMKWGKK